MLNEDIILRNCIQNDRKAQKLLYENYAPVLLGICIRFTRNKDEAEDILQESFVKIFQNLSSFRKKSSMMSWMKKIVINTAITMYHRNLKHRHHYDIDDLRDRNAGTPELEDLEFTREELLNVIRDLPPGYRMIFNLYAIEGYRHKEIAKKLQIDINTSKSQYSRAKKAIQAKLLTLKQETVKTNDQGKE
jgi:RNA polymerase sigma-70 factor (ECF subfamily)